MVLTGNATPNPILNSHAVITSANKTDYPLKDRGHEQHPDFTVPGLVEKSFMSYLFTLKATSK